jgi:hypothetical protein
MSLIDQKLPPRRDETPRARGKKIREVQRNCTPCSAENRDLKLTIRALTAPLRQGRRRGAIQHPEVRNGRTIFRQTRPSSPCDLTRYER